jgi:hypothetical protein
MSVIRVTQSDRKTLPQKIAKRASIAMSPGYVVISTSGQVDVAVASSVLLLGICMKKVASTDADYALTTSVEVEQIDPTAVYAIDVGTGTLTTAMIGAQYDLKNAYELDLTGTTYKQCKVVGFISTTKALVTFNPNLL